MRAIDRYCRCEYDLNRDLMTRCGAHGLTTINVR
jgi:hypothetical protein